ncbi:hypothetical protein [Clostridium sp. D33t1_170424_F3]|uniref:hypothetical protein n=1 Tax=Clostridium sp. D33t1_170424_F3 TaxID=2787099 RepID=UPI0018AC4AF4|nr:hypothetical protein [Clostridium sp. D33t1_170424_F3]
MKKKHIVLIYFLIGLGSIGLSSHLAVRNIIPLQKSSSKITARYVKDYWRTAPYALFDSAQLTEQEAFQRYHAPAFRGKVVSVQNISLTTEGGTYGKYMALAAIKAEKVFAGEIKEGDLVQVLVPFPIVRNDLEGDTSIISQIRTGTEGIWIPYQITDEFQMQVNGEKLYLSDLAEYEFTGRYGIFLESDGKVLFQQGAYALHPDCTLDEAETYVVQCLRKYAE